MWGFRIRYSTWETTVNNVVYYLLMLKGDRCVQLRRREKFYRQYLKYEKTTGVYKKKYQYKKGIKKATSGTWNKRTRGIHHIKQDIRKTKRKSFRYQKKEKAIPERRREVSWACGKGIVWVSSRAAKRACRSGPSEQGYWRGRGWRWRCPPQGSHRPKPSPPPDWSTAHHPSAGDITEVKLSGGKKQCQWKKKGWNISGSSYS